MLHVAIKALIVARMRAPIVLMIVAVVALHTVAVGRV